MHDLIVIILNYTNEIESNILPAPAMVRLPLTVNAQQDMRARA